MRPGESTLRLLLQPLDVIGLNDPATTEVVVNQPGEAWVEQRGEFRRHDIPELDFYRLDAIATLAAALTNQDVGPAKPLCGTTLPDGQRVQICRPPAVAAGTLSLTIRRPTELHPTVASLAAGGLFERVLGAEAEGDLGSLYAQRRYPEFLAAAVRAHKNILICGKTGSGKTTLAAALIREIDIDERLVTIEDSAEWADLPQRNRVALYYSKGDQGSAQVTSEDLLQSSLRMRPDRVLMQELRDGAAFTYLQGIAAGHPGSITTCHAESASGAFDALRLMMRHHKAGATYPDAEARALLHQMIDVVVHCERAGSRFGISEVMYSRAARAA